MSSFDKVDIPKGVEDIDKTEKKMEEIDLKEKIKIVSIGTRVRFERGH